MAITYSRLKIKGEAIVVVFDICSSSDIIEQLILNGNMDQFFILLVKLKRYLAKAQKVIPFDPYKFVGDGWILLFPANTNGKALLMFLRNLCVFFKKEFRKNVLHYLDKTPRVIGLTFGLEKGRLASMTMYGTTECVGRALNIACRLQNGVGDKDKSPEYKALGSNPLYQKYLKPVKGYRSVQVQRSLRNIQGGVNFRCRKIWLLSPLSL